VSPKEALEARALVTAMAYAAARVAVDAAIARLYHDDIPLSRSAKARAFRDAKGRLHDARQVESAAWAENSEAQRSLEAARTKR